MAAQAFTNFAGNPGSNQPTAYVASDGFVGAPVAAFNPNSPTFNGASFPYGIAASQTIHGYETAATLSLPVTATANTDFTMSIPLGAIITSMMVYTTTVYTASTDAKISIGASAGAATYVALTSILAGGVVTLSPVASIGCAAALLSAPAVPNLYVRVVQTGTPSAVGAATLVVRYILP